MPLLAFEKESGQRVRLRSSGKLKRIAEFGAKIAFERGGLVIPVHGRRSNLFGQLRDTWLKRRQLEIILHDIEGIFLGRGSQSLGIGLPDVRSRLRPRHPMFRIPITRSEETKAGMHAT